MTKHVTCIGDDLSSKRLPGHRVMWRGRLLFAATIAFAACAHTVAPTVVPPAASPRYDDPASWLCVPGRAGDPCQANLDSTEVPVDGPLVVVTAPLPTTAPLVDCFYVYPTVDWSMEPGNHTDFTDTEAIVIATQAQVGHFRDVCNLYVPLYRQVTIGTYFLPDAAQEKYKAVAATDVDDAFVHYLRHDNHGKKIVLIGHSQGAEMIVRLLARHFDDDPAMRARLLLALPIGGHIEVPRGTLVGGTFAHLPLCSGADELACVVAYRSMIAGAAPMKLDHVAPGHVTACVNPTALGTPASRSLLLLTKRMRRYVNPAWAHLATPFIELRRYYSAECVEGPPGIFSLAMSVVAGDPRVNPLDFDGRFFRGDLGLHLVDLQLTQGDLIELVARRVASLGAPRP